MTAADHTRFEGDIGAYLLGALEPFETDAFEAHMDSCVVCRAEVDRLMVARDALPRSVEQIRPPAGLKASLMATVEAEARERAEEVRSPGGAARAPERRSWFRDRLFARPVFAGAVAAVLVAIGIGAGVLVGISGDGEKTATADVITATIDQKRAPAASAELVRRSDGGSILRVKGMQRPQDGKVYEVWVKRGERVTGSSLFTVSSDGHGAAAIPDDLDGADAILVTREPEGGSSQPSEASLVTVDLAS